MSESDNQTPQEKSDAPSTPAGSNHDRSDPQVAASLRKYWRSNLTAMGILLSIWALVGLVCGILIADFLNQFSIGGAPLGFWFAQQGSIFSFVVLIFVYALYMNHMDKKHHDELEEIRRQKNDSRAD